MSDRRSWIVTSILEDGRERRDVLNAETSEGAARIAAGGAGVAEVERVELREACGRPPKRENA